MMTLCRMFSLIVETKWSVVIFYGGYISTKLFLEKFGFLKDNLDGLPTFNNYSSEI